VGLHPPHLERPGTFVSPASSRAALRLPDAYLAYRLDLFENYRYRMAHDLGFDPSPNDPAPGRRLLFTNAIAIWFNDNCP